MMDFTRKLRKWYATHGRDLPWRSSSDPYKIWLSEIILQQTRIAQGIDYYRAFVQNYPGIRDLAAADEKEVLKLWQGLGYYSRARNMHETAKFIVEHYDSNFPATYHELLKLKGVGPYTAAAIASIAFNQPVAVIDGNVIRVLARLFGIFQSAQTKDGKKLFQEKSAEMLDKKDPATHNQALMDFGAIQCTPANPDCKTCIFKKSCFAFRNRAIQMLPVREKKVPVKRRYLHYLVFIKARQGDEEIYLNKRSGADIWRNLYDFPVMETTGEVTQKDVIDYVLSKYGNMNFLKRTVQFKHQLTHRLIIARFYLYETPGDFIPPVDWIATRKKDLGAFPVSRLIEKFMETEKIL